MLSRSQKRKTDKMSLLQQIREDSVIARKAKAVEALFLVTLLGEASRPGLDDGKRESTDAEVVKVVKKFTDGAKELLAAVEKVDDKAKIVACKLELELLAKYTPQQMSEDEIKAAIESFVEAAPGNPNIGQIMGFLKNSFAGKYDAGVASKLVKELLTA